MTVKSVPSYYFLFLPGTMGLGKGYGADVDASEGWQVDAEESWGQCGLCLSLRLLLCL